MRRSSPRQVGVRAVGVAAAEHEPPPPQPLLLRRPGHGRRGRSLAASFTARTLPTSSRPQPEHGAHGRQRRRGRGRCRRRRPIASAERPVRSTAGRRAGGARPARRRRTCAAARATTASNVSACSEAIHPSTTSSSWASWSSTVPLPARKPSTNAAPSAAGVPGVSARPSRPRRRPASTARRRGAAAPPARAPARAPAVRVGERCQDGGQLGVTRRVVDHRQRRLDGAHPLDHRRGRVVVEPSAA